MVAAPLQSLADGADGHHFLYDAHEYLTVHGADVSPYLHDPSYTAAVAAALALYGGSVVAAGAGLGKLQAAARGHLFARPGTVRIGRRAESALDYFRAPAVLWRFEDRFYHLEVVGPTGQAKTSLLEYLAYQDLRDGLTVVIVETVGDLAFKCEAQARVLGRPIFKFDPSSEGGLKLNPLSGEKARVAEQIAEAVVNMDNSKESFFQEFGSVVLRRMFYIAEAYASLVGREPTIRLLRNLIASPAELDRALGIQTGNDVPGKKGRPKKRAPVTVNNDKLDADTRFWVEHQWLGAWDDTMRTRFTAGLQSVIDTLLAHRDIADAFSPEPGDEQLDIRAAIDTPGSLVVLRVDAARYAKAVTAAASLLMQRLQQAAESRPDHVAPPAILYLDEIHNLLGFHNESIAMNYSRWLTLIRKKRVGVVHAYQSYALIPERLYRVLQSNARAKLVSGGQGYHDAEETRLTMGHATKTETSTRRTRRPFSLMPPTVSEGRRSSEQPIYDLSEVRRIPRGEWLYQETRDGYLMAPVKVLAGKAPEHRARRFRQFRRPALRGKEKPTPSPRA